MPSSYVDQQNRAEILYRQGNYTGALTAFDAILKKWPNQKDKPLLLLDRRTATLTKLKRYEDAMKEARRIIKFHATMSSGYLRLGQILQLQEQEHLALQIYELGLAFVSDPAAMKTLRERIVEVNKCIVPVGAKDWLMTVLPLEILQMIFDKLEFAEMVRLLRVSQTWRRVLTSMPMLWRNVDTTPKRKRHVNQKSLEAYGHRSHWIFSSLKLSSMAPGIFRTLLRWSRLVERCILVETMSSKDLITCLPGIMATKGLRQLDIYGACLRIPRAFTLINALPNLVSVDLEIDSAPNDLVGVPDHRIPVRMQSVRFRRQRGARAYHLGDLLADAINLETLNLAGCIYGRAELRHLERLRSIDLSDADSADYVHFPRNIEKIRIDTALYNQPASVVHLEKGRLSQLRSLSIRDRLEVGQASQLMDLLFQCGPQIQNLVLSTYYEGAHPILMEMIRDGHLSMLEDLTLGYTDLKDEDLAEIALHCPRLDTCSLLCTVSITGTGIRKLVEGAPQLKRLALDNLPAVHLDAIEWARNRGISLARSGDR